jgi:hypothetical protein
VNAARVEHFEHYNTKAHPFLYERRLLKTAQGDVVLHPDEYAVTTDGTGWLVLEDRVFRFRAGVNKVDLESNTFREETISEWVKVLPDFVRRQYSCDKDALKGALLPYLKTVESIHGFSR